MIDYLALKSLHVGCVALSGLGFLARGVLSLVGSPLLERRWLKIVPHVVDTILLASAIALSLISSQYPLAQDWLTAKVIGLVLYILCGMMALKRDNPLGTRGVFFVTALLIFAYIVSVALTRDPLGVFRYLLP